MKTLEARCVPYDLVQCGHPPDPIAACEVGGDGDQGGRWAVLGHLRPTHFRTHYLEPAVHMGEERATPQMRAHTLRMRPLVTLGHTDMERERLHITVRGAASPILDGGAVRKDRSVLHMGKHQPHLASDA